MKLRMHRPLECLLLVLSFGLLLGLAGCGTAEQAEIFCDSFRVQGINAGTFATDFPVEGSMPIYAEVTRVGDGTVLYSAQRVVIPVGPTAPEIDFTSDAFNFPAVEAGTMLSVSYFTPPFTIVIPGPGPGAITTPEIPILVFAGACATSSEGETDEWVPTDGRLNPDRHAYAAVYCDAANEQIVVWGIHSPGAGDRNDGTGYLALTVPYSDLPPTPTDGSVLVAENGRVRLYRNMQGELVVIAGPDAEGKEYVVLFDACPASYVQRFIQQGDHLQRTQ